MKNNKQKFDELGVSLVEYSILLLTLTIVTLSAVSGLGFQIENQLTITTLAFDSSTQYTALYSSGDYNDGTFEAGQSFQFGGGQESTGVDSTADWFWSFGNESQSSGPNAQDGELDLSSPLNR